MSYMNPLHQGRLTLIPHLRDAFASLHVYEAPPGSAIVRLEERDSKIVFQLDEVGGGDDRDLFNFPYLFHANGDPWQEANDYLLSLRLLVLRLTKKNGYSNGKSIKFLEDKVVLLEKELEMVSSQRDRVLTQNLQLWERVRELELAERQSKPLKVRLHH